MNDIAMAGGVVIVFKIRFVYGCFCLVKGVLVIARGMSGTDACAGLGAGLQRAHVAILHSFTVLLLLWLLNLPPVLLLLSVQNVTAPPSSALSKPSQLISVSFPVASSSKRLPNVVLTREVYVAGHSRPHPELCPSLGAHLKLLILVASPPSHLEERATIRFTWGHYAKRSDIAICFFLGTPPPTMPKMEKTEDKLYGDLIVGNFVDSYFNLTLKTLSMFEWADTYCSRAPMMLKTSDDMFINIGKLLQFVNAPERQNATKTIWGRVLHKQLLNSTKYSKINVPSAELPSGVFPDFAMGAAYLVTGDCIRILREEALNEPFLSLEDVFVTGVLATKLGIKRINAKKFYNKIDQPHVHHCKIKRGIAFPITRYLLQFDYWKKLLKRRPKCEKTLHCFLEGLGDESERDSKD